MQDLHLTFIQAAQRWHDKQANLDSLEEQLAHLPSNTDLVVLPEMFTTGFSMDAAALAEQMNGNTVAWMKRMAQQKNAVITGSIIIEEDGKFYNRLVWMRPDGTYATYDKRHLFRMSGETNVFTAGTERLVVELKGWKICPLVCYDLRFPVWSRNTDNAYDVLLYVASWPESRSHAWKILLQARAIENLAYVVGVNRVGLDGNSIPYSGDSAIINPKGQVLFTVSGEAYMHSDSLSYETLASFRQSFPAYLDSDAFKML